MLCASFLGSGDLKRAVSVSRNFKAIFEAELYRKVDWRFLHYPSYRSYPSKMIKLHHPTHTKSKNGHALALSIIQNSAIAAKIRCLKIECYRCVDCEHQSESSRRALSCTLIIPEVMCKFSTLRELCLKDNWRDLYVDLPILPNLEILILVGRGDGMTVLDEGLPFMNFMRSLNHPKLRQLTAGLTLRPVEPEERLATFEKSVSKGSLRTLTLPAATIEASTLEILLQQFPNLKSLNISSRSSFWADEYPNGTVCTWDQLYRAVLATTVTLEELSLKCPSELNREDKTLLGSLRPFHGLKRLAIDPKMLIGRYLCPVLEAFGGAIDFDPENDSEEEEDASGHYEEPSAGEVVTILESRFALASMLPDNLEQLTLFVDLSQTKQVYRYREDILDGLITEKCSRLHQLREIIFQEGFWTHLLTYVPGRCRCELDSPNPCAEYDTEHKLLMEQSQHAVEACKGVGIELKLVESLSGAREISWVTAYPKK